MSYQLKNYDQLLGIEGLSDHLLKNHFTLYQGYVTNTNKLYEKLNLMLKEGKASSPEYSELKRRFGWEWNGMRLHELYFDNLTKGGSPANPETKSNKKIVEAFGSYESWETEFKATAGLRGIGWVALYLDPLSNKLFNTWINEHDVGHLAGCSPLLIMDLFEHAFMIDGLKKPDYINTFLKNVDWVKVESRLTP